MKFVLILLLAPCILYGQNKSPFYELEKYAYSIFDCGSNRQSVTAGTCFFIKIRDRLFLCSANHVLAGCYQNRKIANFPDTLFVRVKYKGVDKYKNFPVYVKKIHSAAKCDIYYKSPDFELTEMFGLESFEINSIEGFIEYKIDDSSLKGLAIMCGYPSANLLSPLTCNWTGSIRTSDYNIQTKLSDSALVSKGIYDKINYYALPITLPVMPGMSGSPVFLYKKDNSIVFGGVVSKMDINKKDVVLVKPSQIYKVIRAKFQ